MGLREDHLLTACGRLWSLMVVLVNVVSDPEVTSTIGDRAVAGRDRIVPGGEIKFEPVSKR
jgi:hypothetical protein